MKSSTPHSTPHSTVTAESQSHRESSESIFDTRPIGVFDSGLGGLTVVKALRERLPKETILYFGDTARVPYGNKSPELVKQYAHEISDFLISHGVKLIVVACNTASAVALESLQLKNSIPVLGVIKPGATAAIQATKNNHIGIIGTLSTIRSKAYTHALEALNPTVETTGQACPLFVPLAEEGWLNGEIPEKIVAHYLQPLNDRKIDTLILGCTHYPILKNVIASQISPNTLLIDSADAVAKDVEKCLSGIDQLNTNREKGNLSCFVSDVPMRFETVGKRFLGAPIDDVQTITNF